VVADAEGQSRDDVRGLCPGAPLRGSASLPCSKSLAQRVLLIASQARGSTRLEGLRLERACDDVRAAVELVRELGTTVEALENGVRLEPSDARAWRPRAALNAGESATLARLATALLAFRAPPHSTWTLTGERTLLARTSTPLFEALRAGGARIEHSRGSASWPLRIAPCAPGRVVRLEAPASSQEVSALLLALSALAGPRELEVAGAIPSRPYVDMTIACLSRFGVSVETSRHRSGVRLAVRGELAAPARPWLLEPDASAAAVALAAACLSDGELSIEGLAASSLQSDVRIADYLARFGCRAEAGPGGLCAGGRPLRGAAVDLSGQPDLAPVLAAVGACAAWSAGGTTELSGLGTLSNKESPRLAVLAAALRRLGLAVEADGERLRIAPGAESGETPVRLDARGDHRMAFAFALLGLVRPGIEVSGADCVAKSWPSFWEDLAAWGARTACYPARP